MIDDTRAALAAIREQGIKIDPAYPGECRQLFGNRGTRMQYQRASGLDLDGVGELLADRGFTLERLSPAATMAILEDLFTPTPKTKGRARVNHSDVDAKERKARHMRLRKFVCPECQQIARGTRSSSLVCGLCYEMKGEIHAMVRVDPLPEEVLQQTREIH